MEFDINRAYIIVTGRTIEEMQQNVVEKLKEGYQLWQGLTVISRPSVGTSNQYFREMVLPPPQMMMPQREFQEEEE